MKKIISSVFGILSVIVVFVVIGNLILTEFPQLLPFWQEVKRFAIEGWNVLTAKYGVVIAVIIIVGFAVLLGTSAKG